MILSLAKKTYGLNVSEPDHLQGLTVKEIVYLYNKATGKDVKKFSTKPIGIKRIWPLFQRELDEQAKVKKKQIKKRVAAIKEKKRLNKETVSSVLLAMFTSGENIGKDNALGILRKKFPAKNIPNWYYSWYRSHFIRKGLLSKPGVNND